MGGDLVAGALGKIGQNLAATEKLEAMTEAANLAAASAAKAAMTVGMSKMKMGMGNRNANTTPTGGSAKRMEAIEERMTAMEETFNDTETRFNNFNTLLKDTRNENKANTTILNEMKDKFDNLNEKMAQMFGEAGNLSDFVKNYEIEKVATER
jgi:methyl-accepting chemotaxis protein